MISFLKGGITGDKSITLSVNLLEEIPGNTSSQVLNVWFGEEIENATHLYEINIPSWSGISEMTNPDQLSFSLASAARCGICLSVFWVSFVCVSNVL